VLCQKLFFPRCFQSEAREREREHSKSSGNAAKDGSAAHRLAHISVRTALDKLMVFLEGDKSPLKFVPSVARAYSATASPDTVTMSAICPRARCHKTAFALGIQGTIALLRSAMIATGATRSPMRR
jgi:hypothetical protein